MWRALLRSACHLGMLDMFIAQRLRTMFASTVCLFDVGFMEICRTNSPLLVQEVLGLIRE